MIKLVDMVSCIMQMKISMRVNGLKTRQTEKESISMRMAQHTMGNGKMINSMESELSLGLTVLFMRGNIMMEKRTDLGS